MLKLTFEVRPSRNAPGGSLCRWAAPRYFVFLASLFVTAADSSFRYKGQCARRAQYTLRFARTRR